MVTDCNPKDQKGCSQSLLIIRVWLWLFKEWFVVSSNWKSHVFLNSPAAQILSQREMVVKLNKLIKVLKRNQWRRRYFNVWILFPFSTLLDNFDLWEKKTFLCIFLFIFIFKNKNRIIFNGLTVYPPRKLSNSPPKW